MRKVIDTNALQSDELRSYLAASRQNSAVLTEYASIEVHKGDTLKSIFSSLGILSTFPAQVIILKGTQALCALKGRGKGLQRRFIDAHTTADFAKYCAQLAKARAGDARLQAQILRLGKDADAIVDRLLAAVPDVTEGRKQVADYYTDAELRIIRTHGVPSQELKDKIVKNLLLLAGFLFRDHPRVIAWPDFETLFNRYIFRYALCTHLWLLDWVSHGSSDEVSARRVRNDLIDLHFATCATYFDGLMSNDGVALRVYRTAARQLAP